CWPPTGRGSSTSASPAPSTPPPTPPPAPPSARPTSWPPSRRPAARCRPPRTSSRSPRRPPSRRPADRRPATGRGRAGRPGPGPPAPAAPSGPPHFMAPEQASGGEVSAATDVFALAQTAAFAALGRPLYGDGPGVSVLYRIVHSAPDLSELPDRLRGLLARCLVEA